MYIDIIYPKMYPYFLMRKKGKTLLKRAGYTERNYVFTLLDKDSLVSINKSSVHIRIDAHDSMTKRMVGPLLITLFGKRTIGVKLSHPINSIDLSSLNYVLL